MAKWWGAALAAACALFGAQASAGEMCGAATHERSGELRAYFSDVLAACRSDGYCSAVVALPDRSGGGAAYAHQLRVGRPAGALPYQVELTATTPMPDAPPSRMSLAIGQQDFDFAANQITSVSLNEFRLDAARAEAVVTQLKAGRNARWTYVAAGADAEAVFPLRGMTAALAWIDCLARGHGAE